MGQMLLSNTPSLGGKRVIIYVEDPEIYLQCIHSYTINFPTSTTRDPLQHRGGTSSQCHWFYRKSQHSTEGGVRLGAVSRRFYKTSGLRSLEVNAVCGFPMSFCEVFIRNSVRFCGISTSLRPPQYWWCHSLHFSHSIQFKTSAVLSTRPGGSGFEQVKSNPLISKSFFKGFLITSGSTTFNHKTRELNACKMAGDTQPRCRVFWVIYKMADLKLGSRLLRDLVKHPHLRDQEFCQISYYSPATGEEIESNSRVMPGPPPLGLNFDRKIPRGKS